MYLLDANVFIDAKNFYYRFDTFPGFWEWLDAGRESGLIASIEPIRDELLKGNDELADWVKERKNSGWFIPVDDDETQEVLAKVANWVQGQRFKDSAKSEFLGCGDPWLIAKAKVIGATVVTLEKYEENSRKKVPIPNVCRAFGVLYCDTFDLLRKMDASFTMHGGQK